MGSGYQSGSANSSLFDKPAGRKHEHCNEAVVRSPPDGHTLFLFRSGNAINATLL